MNKPFKLILAIGTLLLPLWASSQAICPVSANIYFINGVNKPTKSEVIWESLQLRDTLATFSTKASGIRKVDYLYNDSEGLLLDVLYNFASQKAAERNASIADYFVSVGLAAFNLISPLSAADQSAVRQLVAGTITASLSPHVQALVSQFAARVQGEALNAGIQAVLVPHSQGNMFANEVFDNLKLSLPTYLFRGLGVVNVANPASRAPSNLYLTAYQDLVINLLASNMSLFNLTLAPMPPNFDASAAAWLSDPTGHGFSEVYLSQKLPYSTAPAYSIAAALAGKVDSALYQTSTFLDTPSFIYVNGVKTPKPPGYPADSTLTQVCFPAPVGGM